MATRKTKMTLESQPDVTKIHLQEKPSFPAPSVQGTITSLDSDDEQENLPSLDPSVHGDLFSFNTSVKKKVSNEENSTTKERVDSLSLSLQEKVIADESSSSEPSIQSNLSTDPSVETVSGEEKLTSQQIYTLGTTEIRDEMLAKWERGELQDFDPHDNTSLLQMFMSGSTLFKKEVTNKWKRGELMLDPILASKIEEFDPSIKQEIKFGPKKTPLATTPKKFRRWITAGEYMNRKKNFPECDFCCYSPCTGEFRKCFCGDFATTYDSSNTERFLDFRCVGCSRGNIRRKGAAEEILKRLCFLPEPSKATSLNKTGTSNSSSLTDPFNGAANSPSLWLTPEAYIRSLISNLEVKRCSYSPTKGENKDKICSAAIEHKSNKFWQHRCTSCPETGKGTTLIFEELLTVYSNIKLSHVSGKLPGKFTPSTRKASPKRRAPSPKKKSKPKPNPKHEVPEDDNDEELILHENSNITNFLGAQWYIINDSESSMLCHLVDADNVTIKVNGRFDTFIEESSEVTDEMLLKLKPVTKVNKNWGEEVTPGDLQAVYDIIA
jgi:hypothetical protein